MQAGDKILYEGREATLIKPMTPYGFPNAQGEEGQCWEIKIKDLPCTIYRWLRPSNTSPVNMER